MWLVALTRTSKVKKNYFYILLVRKNGVILKNLEKGYDGFMSQYTLLLKSFNQVSYANQGCIYSTRKL